MTFKQACLHHVNLPRHKAAYMQGFFLASLFGISHKLSQGETQEDENDNSGWTERYQTPLAVIYSGMSRAENSTCSLTKY